MNARQVVAFAGMLCVVAFLAFLLLSRGNTTVQQSVQSSGQAAPQAVAQLTPTSTPCVPPPGYIRCPEEKKPTPRPKVELQKPDFGGIGNALRPQPLATPTATPQSSEPPFFSVPVAGGLARGLWSIVLVIDWLLRNLWIFLIAIVLFFIVRGVWRILAGHGVFLGWEIIQTLFLGRLLEGRDRDRGRDRYDSEEDD